MAERRGGGLFPDAGDCGIDEDAAAVFTDDDFFAHLDFKLFLRRDAVETAAACVALDIDYSEAVTGVLADALERVECAGVNHRLEVFGLLAEAFFILAGLADDFLKFGALFGEHMLGVGDFLFGHLDVACAVVDVAGVFADMFFAELDFESLEFNLF